VWQAPNEFAQIPTNRVFARVRWLCHSFQFLRAVSFSDLPTRLARHEHRGCLIFAGPCLIRSAVRLLGRFQCVGAGASGTFAGRSLLPRHSKIIYSFACAAGRISRLITSLIAAGDDENPLCRRHISPCKCPDPFSSTIGSLWQSEMLWSHSYVIDAAARSWKSTRWSMNSVFPELTVREMDEWG